LQYSNVIKKNSVPLKEVLTRRSASMSRASFEDAEMRAFDDARDACVIFIGANWNRGKHLYCSVFLIHVQRIPRAMSARMSRAP
jgi:hypothetical protein